MRIASLMSDDNHNHKVEHLERKISRLDGIVKEKHAKLKDLKIQNETLTRKISGLEAINTRMTVDMNVLVQESNSLRHENHCKDKSTFILLHGSLFCERFKIFKKKSKL